MKKIIPILIVAILSGCYSIPNVESYYYDQWYGDFCTEIRYTGSDEVYQFYIGYEDPNKGRLQGFELPPDKIPHFPDFIQMEVDGTKFVLSELTPELVSKHSFRGPHKAQFIQYGDTAIYSKKYVTIHFYQGKPVYFYCTGGDVVFRNIHTGKSGSFPMSVRKMKSIFGEPTRSKKDVVL